jgi:hypothetical protein
LKLSSVVAAILEIAIHATKTKNAATVLAVRQDRAAVNMKSGILIARWLEIVAVLAVPIQKQ